MTNQHDSELTPEHDNTTENEAAAKPLTSFADIEKFLENRPDITAYLDSLDDYPVKVINRDGSVVDDHFVCASTQEWALKHFDRFFMQWHNTRELLRYRLAEFDSPSFPNAIAIELYDAHSGNLLVRHDLYSPNSDDVSSA